MLQTLRQFFAPLPVADQTLIVAVSGGVDSLALLVALDELRGELGYWLHVASYDHGLRGVESRADADFVRDFATRRGLPVTIGAAAVPMSSENAGRWARYEFLAETALKVGAGYIVLGHHRDDQAETVLLHLIRGTGLAGLRGILPLTPLSDNHLSPEAAPELLEADLTLLRPLLGVSRAEIEAFAQAHHLAPRQDASNHNPRYLRNRIRAETLPHLETLNPAVRESLVRLARVAAGDYDIVQEAVAGAVESLVEWGENDAGDLAYVDWHGWRELPTGLARGVLRHLLLEFGPSDLAYERVEDACHLLRTGATGQQMHLAGQVVLSLGYDEFTLGYGGDLPYPRHLPSLPPRAVVPLPVEGEKWLREGLRFYSYWVLEHLSQELRRPNPLEATLVIPPDAELTLRTRRAGDRFAPLGLGGSRQKLSDTFTNLKVPVSLRDRVPLLLVNDEIAWFVAPSASGVCTRISENFAVREGRTSIMRVRWELSDGE